MIPSAIIVILLIVVLLSWLVRKRKVGNFSAGIGNALFQFHAFIRPTVYNILESRKQRKKENRQGDDGPPELPWWAESSWSRSELEAGIEILNPVLSPHGFKFIVEQAGKGSGGYFASGRYERQDRSLELHFRYTLGLVTYHIGNLSLDHETYMHFLGVHGRNSYPDFPKDPIDSFQSLARDLRRYCGDFLSGDGSQFKRHAEEFQRNPKLFAQPS